MKQDDMIDTLLFDWGDTLMIDFPGMKGKMCDWPLVEAAEGAGDLLEQLSSRIEIYIATGAADSSEADIQKAFQRVGLDRYIRGYFCSANLGVGKDSPQFFPEILKRLNKPADQVAMVGDSLERDVLPATAAGMQGYWFTKQATGENVVTVSHLSQLAALINNQGASA